MKDSKPASLGKACLFPIRALGSIHSTPKEFENAASTVIHTNPTRKRSFSKTLFKPEEFENAHQTELFGPFQKRWRHDNHVISLTEFSSNTNPKWPVIVAFLNSSGEVWTENI